MARRAEAQRAKDGAGLAPVLATLSTSCLLVASLPRLGQRGRLATSHSPRGAKIGSSSPGLLRQVRITKANGRLLRGGKSLNSAQLNASLRRIGRRHHKIPMAVMWPPYSKCRPLNDREWARRRWRGFRPIRDPIIILGTGFLSYPLDLIGTKSSVPYDRPLCGQALQINQTIFAGWSGLPSKVADFDFCAVGFGNNLFVRRNSKHTIYPAILLPQFLQSISVALPTPTVKEYYRDDAND
jgi:hypothetical protein